MGQATEKLEPRIYVACLAAYNNGWLHGAWIDVEDDADAVRDAIGAMLNASPVAGAEEYAIHDHEGFGVFASLADCLQDLTEETTVIPETLRLYIDYEAMARDARLNGEVFTVETGPDQVHVFWTR